MDELPTDDEKRESEAEWTRARFALSQAVPGQLYFIELTPWRAREALPEFLHDNGVVRPYAYFSFRGRSDEERSGAPVWVVDRFLRSLKKPVEILYVDGLEAHEDFKLQHAPGDALEQLNLGREMLAGLPVVIVFLMPTWLIDMIRAHALNLWSWRAHHFTLTEERIPVGEIAPIEVQINRLREIPIDSAKARHQRIQFGERMVRVAEARGEDLARNLLQVLHFANDLTSAGRAAEALELLKGLKVSNSEYEGALVDTAVANALFRLGRLDESFARAERALETHRKRGHPGDMNVSFTKFLMGVVERARGNLAKAESCLLEALEGASDVGASPASRSLILYEMGSIYLDMDRLPEAEQALENSLSLLKAGAGNQRGTLGRVLLALGALKVSQGQQSAAEALFRRAKGIYERMASELFLLAIKDARAANFEQAKTSFDEALGMAERTGWLSHPTARHYMDDYVEMLRGAGRMDEADEIERRRKTAAPPSS